MLESECEAQRSMNEGDGEDSVSNEANEQSIPK